MEGTGRLSRRVNNLSGYWSRKHHTHHAEHSDVTILLVSLHLAPEYQPLQPTTDCVVMVNLQANMLTIILFMQHLWADMTEV